MQDIQKDTVDQSTVQSRRTPRLSCELETYIRCLSDGGNHSLASRDRLSLI